MSSASQASPALPKLWLTLPIALAVFTYAVSWQWTSGTWLFRQLNPLPGVLFVSPIPDGHAADINFWFGQFLGVVGICLGMYMWVNNTRVVETYVLDVLFYTDAQKALFRFLFMKQLKDVVFMFSSQQVP